MCRAIEEMRMESIEEGIAIGEEKGIAKGVEKGALDTLLTNVKTLMKNMKMTAEHAMDILEINEEKRAVLMKML